MSFKESLLKKISLDRMKQRVLATLGPVGGGSKVDKKAMRELLAAAGSRTLSRRGLELYLPEGTSDGDKQTILVLDNDLPLYDSTVDDVVMRKEPTVKEMISIRNAMRILNDSDVVISRKETSVETVYQEGLSRLDLSFTEEDIKQLEYEGRGGVEWKDDDTVLECLSLFAELLDLAPEPAELRIEHHHIRGRLSRARGGGEAFGPAVVYSLGDSAIRWISEIFPLADKEAVERFRAKAQGKRDPDLLGPAVIKHLSEEAMRMAPGS